MSGDAGSAHTERTLFDEFLKRYSAQSQRCLFPDPIMIYPNIVNMLGETTVDVNALCLERTQTYILMIEEREVSGEQQQYSTVQRMAIATFLVVRNCAYEVKVGKGAEDGSD